MSRPALSQRTSPSTAHDHRRSRRRGWGDNCHGGCRQRRDFRHQRRRDRCVQPTGREGPASDGPFREQWEHRFGHTLGVVRGNRLRYLRQRRRHQQRGQRHGAGRRRVFTDLRVINSNLSNNGNSGLRIATSLTSFDGLTMTGGQVNGNVVNGLSINPGQSDTPVINNISIDGTSFSGNGTGNFAGTFGGGLGDISISGFNGNLSLNNVTVTGLATEGTKNGIAHSRQERTDGGRHGQLQQCHRDRQLPPNTPGLQPRRSRAPASAFKTTPTSATSRSATCPST